VSSDVQALIDAAMKARDSAYAPYSNHPVGAAVLTKSGRIFAGCNVENAAFPLGFCAEANAIGAMVQAGGRQIVHVVVAGPGDLPCMPCGGCRQQVREFSGETARPVTICNKDGEIILETTTAELLPHSFGPENVEETRGD